VVLGKGTIICFAREFNQSPTTPLSAARLILQLHPKVTSIWELETVPAIPCTRPNQRCVRCHFNLRDKLCTTAAKLPENAVDLEPEVLRRQLVGDLESLFRERYIARRGRPTGGH
jgi:hypothetical protein